jgi:hypothetical protein
MQLAGAICSICQANVLFDADATWCARCKTVVHQNCLTEAGAVCPSCKRVYENPENRFVFSQMCPACFRPTNPPEPHCSACHTRTQWDTQADYDDFLAHMKDTSHVCVLRGFAELVGAALCLLALVGVFVISSMPHFGTLCTLLFGFMTLTADGLVSLHRSRKIARFR